MTLDYPTLWGRRKTKLRVPLWRAVTIRAANAYETRSSARNTAQLNEQRKNSCPDRDDGREEAFEIHII